MCVSGCERLVTINVRFHLLFYIVSQTLGLIHRLVTIIVRFHQLFYIVSQTEELIHKFF